jgi:site-specific DNA-methyltransferase (adenine-specific)
MKAHLHCDDCVQGIPLRVERGSVDVCVTSPPYNNGTRYNTYNDALSSEQYLEWTLAWTRVVREALRDDGSLFLNLGGSRSLLPHEVICAIVQQKIFVLQNTILWVKSIAVPDDTNGGGMIQRGHYKPINSRRFLHDCHEYVFHLTKRGDVTLDRLALGVPYADKSNIARWDHTGGADLHCPGNTWYLPYKTISNRAKDRPHPATFPVELASNCIKLHGRRDSVVLDPFLGIGHCAIAAAQCRAKAFIGFELDPEYLNSATRALS